MIQSLKRWIFLGLILAAVSSAHAQPLVDEVPDDAKIYLGWQGVGTLGKAYDDSHLAAVIHDTDLDHIFSDAIHALGAAVDKNQPDARGLVDPVEDGAALAWRSQWAIYVRQPDPDPKHPGSAEMRILVKPANDADKAKIVDLFDRMVKDDNGQHLRLDKPEDTGGLVVLTMVEHADETAKYAGKPQHSLAGNPRLAAGLAEAPGTPIAWVYVDVRGVLDEALRVETAQNAGEQDPEQKLVAEKIRAAFTAAGLDRVNGLTFTAGFAGRDWFTHTFIDAPAPRQGLLSLLDAAPLTDQDLAVVPGTAVAVSAGRLDLTAVLEQVRKIVAACGQDQLDEFNNFLTEASSQIGADVEKDLLASLGSSWVLYSDPSASIGPMAPGECLVDALKDPAKAQQVADQVVKSVNAAVAADQPQQGGEQAKIQVADQQGVKCYSISMSSAMLVWAIADGRLFVSVSPQAVTAAVAAARQPDKSLVKSDKYQAMLHRLGDRTPISLQYMDLPASAQQMYQSYAMTLQMMSMLGVPVAGVALPPLEKILPHLAPAGSATWVDDSGLRMVEVMPFPGSVYLSPHGLANIGTLALAGAVGAGVAIFEHAGDRPASVVQANGVQTGQTAYAQANNGRYSDDIAELVRGQFLPPQSTLAPTTQKKLPGDFADWPQDRQDHWVRENASYILIPGLRNDNDAHKAAVFLRPDDSTSGKIDVVFNDNHVDQMPVQDAAQLIQQQTGKTLEELVARQVSYMPQDKPAGPPPELEPVPAPEPSAPPRPPR